MKTKTMMQLSILLLGAASAASAWAGGTVASTGVFPIGVAVADFNGDGMPDVVTVNWDSQDATVLVNTTGSGSTDLSLAAPQSFPVTGDPAAVTVADFNGDGKPDLIVADGYDNTVSVYINTTTPGSQTITFAPPQTFPAGLGLNSVVVADINGDGLPDIVATDWNGMAAVVLINTSTPGSSTLSFAPAQSFPVGNTPTEVAVADFNGDGLPDLALVNTNDNTVSVLINTTVQGSATASFAPQQVFPAGNMPQAIAAGDLNGDGMPDLVVAGYGDSNEYVLVNTTTRGSMTVSFAPEQSLPGAVCANSAVVADVNGDGVPDIVVPDACSNQVVVLVNTTIPGSTTLSFLPAQGFSINPNDGGWSEWGTVADMNGDGMPELVVVNDVDNTVSVLLNATAPGDTTLNFQN